MSNVLHDTCAELGMQGMLLFMHLNPLLMLVLLAQKGPSREGRLYCMCCMCHGDDTFLIVKVQMGAPWYEA